MRFNLSLLPLALAVASPTAAEVVSSTPHGFETVTTVNIEASAEDVYAALGKVGHWWDPQHTYSGDAANLSIELRPGGCFCERFERGGAEHMRVVHVRPDETLAVRRLRA